MWFAMLCEIVHSFLHLICKGSLSFCLFFKYLLLQIKMCNVVIHPVARWFGLIKTYCQRLFKIPLGKWIKTTSNVASTEIFDSAFSRLIFCNIGCQWQCFISNHETRVKLSPLSCLLYMPRMPPSYVSVVDLKKLRKSEIWELRKNILNSEFFFIHIYIYLMACRVNR